MNTPSAGLLCAQTSLRANRLLLPIDLKKCPLDCFSLANRFARPFEGEIVLMHVLDRRTCAAQRAVSREAIHRAGRYLERLGDDYLRPTVEASFRLRIGIPHEEILAEATATNVDLILLPVFAQPFWRRFVGIYYGETTRALIVDAPCRVFVVDAQARFNCFRHWARKEDPGEWAA
jgi:nucleotide-binding universal stress UspA family protein